jgi:zinc protease
MRRTAGLSLCLGAVFGSTVATAQKRAPRAPAAAPAAPATPVKGATVEGITEYSLANGLKVLLFPDATQPKVTINVTYLVGSRHEGYGETGMAHLLEHMVFKGTPSMRNIPKELEARGASYNGTTSFDRTNYYETLNASDENVAWALGFEADRMVNSFIAKEDLQTEYTVVRNEYEGGENSPQSVLFKRVLATAYDWHNYGNLPIGARADIEGVPIERLQAFYRRYYQPDNAILVVAGKFDEAKTLKVIGETFGRVPKPVRSLDRGNLLYPTYTRDGAQDGERQVTLRRAGDVQLVGAAYHVVAGTHPDFAPLRVLSFVLGDTPSGRLYKALVEKKLAVQTFAQPFQLREPGLLAAFAVLRKEDNLDAARAALLETLESLAANPVTKAEVDRAKTSLLKDIELSFNNSQASAIGLSEYASFGDWRLAFLTRDWLEKVTPEDVNRVAAQYLKQSNRTVGQFIPTEKADRTEVAEATDPSTLVRDYKGRAAVALGEAFDPSPENIDGRTVRTSWPGGFETALLAKRTRGEAVRAALTLRLGTAETLKGQGTVAQLTAAMLQRGAAGKTRQQLKDAFDQLKARANVGGQGNQVVANVETTRGNLVPTLRLLAEVLKAPSFDSTEFDQLVKQSQAQIEAGRSEPQVKALTAIQRALTPRSPGDVGYVETTDEALASLKAVTLAQLKAFHAKFYGASAATLVVVGDFDRDTVTSVAKELFGSWKSPSAFARVPSVYAKMKDTVIAFETPDKAQAWVAAGTTIPMRDDNPDYPALQMGAYIFGGSPLNSRIVARLRQKEGLSYGAGAQLVVGPFDPAAVFLTFAILAPENAARLEAAMREELVKLTTEGVTAEELERNKAGWLQERAQSRAADGALAALLGQQVYYKRTTAWDAALEAKVKALTVEQVNAALKQYIDPKSFVLVKAGDFAGAAKKAQAVKP